MVHFADDQPPGAPAVPPVAERERSVHLRRRLNAPPERVLRVWADPEELPRWLPERVEGDLAIRSRTTLVWSDRRIWWEVLEAERGRFVFRRPHLGGAMITTVRLTITPVGYGSRVDLVDGPFPIAQPEGLEAWAQAIEGWSDALAQLRAYLDFSVDLRART